MKYVNAKEVGKLIVLRHVHAFCIIHRKNTFLYYFMTRNQSGKRYQNTLVSAAGVQDH
jgi:hypothetical protein